MAFFLCLCGKGKEVPVASHFRPKPPYRAGRLLPGQGSLLHSLKTFLQIPFIIQASVQSEGFKSCIFIPFIRRMVQLSPGIAAVIGFVGMCIDAFLQCIQIQGKTNAFIPVVFVAPILIIVRFIFKKGQFPVYQAVLKVYDVSVLVVYAFAG